MPAAGKLRRCGGQNTGAGFIGLGGSEIEHCLRAKQDQVSGWERLATLVDLIFRFLDRTASLIASIGTRFIMTAVFRQAGEGFKARKRLQLAMHGRPQPDKGR